LESIVSGKGKNAVSGPEPSSKIPKVTIIIPVYNESLQISKVIDRVLNAPLPSPATKEVIVVDDGSTDGTTEILDQYRSTLVKVHHSMLNFGKGTAIRIGLKHATGDIIVIQDGDQEYDPNEIQLLVRPIMEGKASVVYGSRFMGSIKRMFFKYRLVNKLLVWAVRGLYGAAITDEATAYKAFDRRVIEGIPLECKRFEFCPEITAKVLRSGVAIHEVPITYFGRSVEEGKKIKFRDGIEAFWTLLRFRFWRQKKTAPNV
jgi:dolichol-phosphate mannosyltransferase